MSKAIVWTLDDALLLSRLLYEPLEKIGYGIGIGGSVIYKGASSKDLDFIVFPLNTDKRDISLLYNTLYSLNFKLRLDEAEVKARWLENHQSTDQKHVEVWTYKGKRVDFFFLE